MLYAYYLRWGGEKEQIWPFIPVTLYHNVVQEEETWLCLAASGVPREASICSPKPGGPIGIILFLELCVEFSQHPLQYFYLWAQSWVQPCSLAGLASTQQADFKPTGLEQIGHKANRLPSQYKLVPCHWWGMWANRPRHNTLRALQLSLCPTPFFEHIYTHTHPWRAAFPLSTQLVALFQLNHQLWYQAAVQCAA